MSFFTSALTVLLSFNGYPEDPSYDVKNIVLPVSVEEGDRENCNPYALIDATFLTSTAVLDDEELWLFEVFVVLETHAH